MHHNGLRVNNRGFFAHVVLAAVTGSSFHKCCYEEQEKRKQFFREDFN